MLGLAFGLAVTIGNTIGAGILRTPGDIAGLLPNALGFIGIWVIGDTYALLGANALAELGTMMPRSGGQYVFAHDIFGAYVGFVVGWMDWISTSASTAAIATVIGERPSVWACSARGGPDRDARRRRVHRLVLGGTKRGDRAQQVTSLIKAVVLIGLVVACFAFGGRAASKPPRRPRERPHRSSGFVAFLLAAQSVIYAYDGWNGPIYFSEELNDPSRQIPRGMFYGLAGVATIYLLINLAFLYAVPLTSLAGSKLAAGTVANSLFGRRGAHRANSGDRLAAQRRERVHSHVFPDAVFDEPRRIGNSGGVEIEPPRHANDLARREWPGGSGLHRDRNVREHDRRGRVLLRGELRDVVPRV